MPFLFLLMLIFATAWYSFRRDKDNLKGRVVVIDGDTVDIGGERVRLVGFDALEMGQAVIIAGRRINGGKAAKIALRRFLSGKKASCEISGRDRWGRALGRLYADGQDVGAWMVSRGLAIVDPRFDQRYLWKERAARLAKRGIWQGKFVMPWRWRKGERLGQASIWLAKLIFMARLAALAAAGTFVFWLIFR